MGITNRERGKHSIPGLFHVRGGSIGFGTSLADGGKGDALLYRKAINELALGAGDSLTVPGSATVGGVLFATGDNVLSGIQGFGTGGTAFTISAGVQGTVTWREDVNMYWSAAGILKTDDTLDASTGGVMTKLATGAVAVATLANVGELGLQFSGGTGRLIANVSGTMYFAALTVKP